MSTVAPLMVAVTMAVDASDFCYDVTHFGAVGDGITDDTKAFVAAAAAAAPTAACVRVPPVRLGGGFVLSSTVSLAPGVSLIGEAAGFAPNPHCYGPPGDFNTTGGSRILARPATSSLNATAGTGAPLFHLLGTGCSVRGLMVLYDRVPFPTDAEMERLYPTFEAARRGFVADHVPPFGPTFYITAGVRVQITDVIGAGFRHLIYFAGRGHGMSHIRRVQGWGWDTLVTVVEAQDVLTFEQLRFTINSGPWCLGARPAACDHEAEGIERCRGNFTVLPAVVALRPSNVMLWMGRADGYVARDLFGFGVHTALRLGSAPGEYQLRDPVTGSGHRFLAQASAQRLGTSGACTASEPHATLPFGAQPGASGPWGSVSQLMADQCVYGIHLVWPNPLTNRISDVQLHPSFWLRGSSLAAANGSGTDLSAVGLEAGVMVEPSHSLTNNNGLVPTLILSSLVVASFNDSANFGPAGAMLGQSNGRAFLIGGDGLVDVRGFAMNNERDGDTHMWARTSASVGRLRMTSVVLNYEWADDVLV